MYTISNRFHSYNIFNYPCIELPNGAKCNPRFYWHCVSLGILDPNKD